MPEGFDSLPAFVLAGGTGSRLKAVLPDKPKPLAEVLGRPFLGFLLDQLETGGIRDVVLCTGHLADEVAKTFGDRYRALRLHYSCESTPLGTGGAIRFALEKFPADHLMVLNGDSFLDVPLAKFIASCMSGGGGPRLVAVRVPDCSRFGTIVSDEEDLVLRFDEKEGVVRPGWINGGMYFLSAGIFKTHDLGAKFSIEYDIIPKLVTSGLRVFKATGEFIDIGTPESLEKAGAFFQKMLSEKR